MLTVGYVFRPSVVSSESGSFPPLTILNGPDFGESLGRPIGGTDTVKEVRILTVPVPVVPDHFLKLFAFLIVFSPFAIVVGTLCVLQLIKQHLVLVYYLR